MSHSGGLTGMRGGQMGMMGNFILVDGMLFRREGQHSMASACVPQPSLRQSAVTDRKCGMSRKDGLLLP
jgi:hypothetical protein